MIINLFHMFFFHILDDFCLQGILANMKQKAWWEEHAPQSLYRNDYMAALIIHAISWSIMIMIPVCWSYVEDVSPFMYTIVLIFNTTIHAYVDHLKANQHKINLITDQLLHSVQIIITWLLFII